MADAGARTWSAPRTGSRLYYGWIVLGLAALAMVGTLPGRTQGLGLITEPLIRDLGVDPRRLRADQPGRDAARGALLLRRSADWIDRYGSRLVLTGGRRSRSASSCWR